MEGVRREYKRSSIYITSLIKQMQEVIEYFQEAEDIMSLEPVKSRLHVLAERTRQRKEEAKELMQTLQKEETKVQ